MEVKEIAPAAEDFVFLWQLNPIAREQLHWIVVERLLKEAEEMLERQNASASHTP